MNKAEFIKYIGSIGFTIMGSSISQYKYKEFRIYLFDNDYSLFNGSKWINDIPLNDLELIEKNFKKELRSFKLKALLR